MTDVYFKTCSRHVYYDSMLRLVIPAQIRRASLNTKCLLFGSDHHTRAEMIPIEITLQQEIDVMKVIELADKAAESILAIYNSPTEDWEVKAKADDSPLTLADQNANTVICEGLSCLSPHIPIVSEENKQVSYDIKRKYQYNWIIDPLDGTKEFIKRNGQFTVNIALVRDGKPYMGVVQVPVTGKAYWAVHGQGAWVRDSPTSQPRRLLAAEYDPHAEGLIIVGSASHSSPQTAELVSEYSNPIFKQLGSSLKLLMVAEGAAHVYPRLAPTCEWDTAAAHAIVLEAGGLVIQAGKCDNKGTLLPDENWRSILAQEIPVEYNKPDPLNPYFVVYGRRTRV